MVDHQVQQTLNQFSETSKEKFGSYAHAAGFLESVLGMVLSSTMTHKEALDHIAKWIGNNQI